jgi:2-oxoglutarate dehydrogenase E1 component
MRVAMPSTPASYFHLLRRQALSARRKPLVVFTPKSMLRLKAATSQIVDFTDGTFEPVIADHSVPAEQVRRVLLCSGKIYYDLVRGREKSGRTDTAIVRLEQLYPLPGDEVHEALADYRDAEVIWTQEEPANMGAWQFLALNLQEYLSGTPLRCIARPASASPAAGSHTRHEEEQQALVAKAFAAR